MSFKSILVHIDGSEHCKGRLDAAIRLAVDSRALLICISLLAGTDLAPPVTALRCASSLPCRPEVTS